MSSFFLKDVSVLFFQERNPDTNTAIAIEDVFFLVQKCSIRAYKTSSMVAALPLGNSVVNVCVCMHIYIYVSYVCMYVCVCVCVCV